MRIYYSLFFTILISVSSELLFSQNEEFYEEGWNFSPGGYYKNIFIYQERDNFYMSVNSAPSKKKTVSDLNRIRFSPEVYYGEKFIFHSDINLDAITTNFNNTDEFDSLWKTPGYNDFVKLSLEKDYKKNIYFQSELKNIYMKMVTGKFTWTAGKQQARFGSSRLWNPLDLMNPLSPLTVEGSDEQRGTDALRLDWYPWDSTEITGMASPKRENDSYDQIGAGSGNYIIRLKTGIKKYDGALLAGYTAKRKNFGADFAVVINEGILTGVILHSMPDKGKKYYQCGTGYEYTFASGIYLLVEYFYNSLPVNKDIELQAALYHMTSAGIDYTNYYVLSNRIITYNSHYLSLVTGYDIFPLLRGEVFSIYDFEGKGLFLNVSFKFNVMENLDLTAGVIPAFTGEAGKNSDFYLYNKQPLFFMMLQFYF